MANKVLTLALMTLPALARGAPCVFIPLRAVSGLHAHIREPIIGWAKCSSDLQVVFTVARFASPNTRSMENFVLKHARQVVLDSENAVIIRQQLDANGSGQAVIQTRTRHKLQNPVLHYSFSVRDGDGGVVLYVHLLRGPRSPKQQLLMQSLRKKLSDPKFLQVVDQEA